MIASEFPPKIAGVSNYVYNLSQRLVNEGHEVSVLTRGSMKGLEVDRKNGITVYRARFLPLYPCHARIFELFAESVFRSLENQFEIVHVHYPLPPVLRTSLPVVITFHTTATEQGQQIEIVDCGSAIQKLWFMYASNIESRMLSESDLVTSVSRRVAGEIHTHHHVEARSIVPIGNAVDTSFFVPKHSDKHTYSILYSGRLGYRKGLIDLVRSAKYISRQCPQASFILTGKGPLEAILKRRVEELGLTSRFTFAGYVSRNRLREHYQNASIFLCPSYYEGFPTTLLEAMACGVPVVSTNVGGVSELINNGQNGLIVPARKPEAIADAVLELLQDDEARVSMGKCARETVKEHHNWDTLTCRVLACYESALGN